MKVDLDKLDRLYARYRDSGRGPDAEILGTMLGAYPALAAEVRQLWGEKEILLTSCANYEVLQRKTDDEVRALRERLDAALEDRREWYAKAGERLQRAEAAEAVLRGVLAGYRTFRCVPSDEREWTAYDDEALEAGYNILGSMIVNRR